MWFTVFAVCQIFSLIQFLETKVKSNYFQFENCVNVDLIQVNSLNFIMDSFPTTGHLVPTRHSVFQYTKWEEESERKLWINKPQAIQAEHYCLLKIQIRFRNMKSNILPFIQHPIDIQVTMNEKSTFNLLVYLFLEIWFVSFSIDSTV